MDEHPEPLVDRVVGHARERDGGIQRELLVPPDDAEQVGILRPPEPAQERHRVLDLVAVTRAQEELAQLGVQQLGVRWRSGVQAIAQRVHPGAHVTLAERLAQMRARRGARVFGQRGEGVVDPLDSRLDLLGIARPAQDSLQRSRRERDAAFGELGLVGQLVAALREPGDVRPHVRVDVLEDRARFVPASEEAFDHGRQSSAVAVVDRIATRVRSGA